MTAPGPIPPAVQAFNAEVAKIIKTFVDGLKTQKPPSIIYHYTGDVGLKGILEAGQLWLTDIFDLNDPSELNHGFSLMLKILMTQVGSRSPQGKKFVEGLIDFNRRIGIQVTANYFVCSFSACGNELGQWRAYADNGRGFALGFDAAELEASFTKDGDPWFAQASRVIYDDKQLAQLHAQIISKLIGHICLPCGKAELAHWYTYLTLHALEVGLHFKHMAYDNEQEYRFLEAHKTDIPVPELKRRPRRYSLVKYREFDWRKLAPGTLKKVVVGPADQVKASQFAQDCLALFHSGTVQVTPSDIPYRAV